MLRSPPVQICRSQVEGTSWDVCHRLRVSSMRQRFLPDENARDHVINLAPARVL